MTYTSNYVPYDENSKGLTESLLDLKSTIATDRPYYGIAGFQAVAFENISQGQAVYSRNSDGKVGLAVANSTEELATVAGFAQTTKATGEIVRVIIVGVAPNSGLTPGASYYLSSVSPGSITTTPPSTPGHYVTRVGEAVSPAEFIVQLEPPIGLS